MGGAHAGQRRQRERAAAAAGTTQHQKEDIYDYDSVLLSVGLATIVL